MDFLMNTITIFGYGSASAEVLNLTEYIAFKTSTELIEICAVIHMFVVQKSKQHRTFDCHQISTPDLSTNRSQLESV